PIKATILRKKSQINAFLPAKPHQGRRDQHVTKTKQTGDRVNGHLHELLALMLYNNGLTLLMHISTLPGDIKTVLKLFHDRSTSSNSSSTYRVLRSLPSSFGLHRSYSEHESHFFS